MKAESDKLAAFNDPQNRYAFCLTCANIRYYAAAALSPGAAFFPLLPTLPQSPRPTLYFFLRLFILRLSTTNLSDAMQKKSIYVAYTGGTIGMQRSEHGYVPVSGHLQRRWR